MGWKTKSHATPFPFPAAPRMWLKRPCSCTTASGSDLVFFETTPIFFEGNDGKTLGRRGFSKDHWPNLKQMIVDVVFKDRGMRLCSKMWPGNTIDVKAVLPVRERMRWLLHV